MKTARRKIANLQRALLESYADAANTDGRTRTSFNAAINPKHQVNAAFLENQRLLDMMPNEGNSGLPVGSYQSKTARLARRTTFRDFDISIETDKGQYRYWYDSNNDTEGKTKMKYPYGYIRRTEGMDGEHVDCFVGPNENAKNVYVVLTNKAPNFDKIDEQKCMLGFDSAEDAKTVFLEHYSDPKFFNSMVTLSYEDFRRKAFDTFESATKKISSELIQKGIGSFNDQTPGDHLFPRGNLNPGQRLLVNNPMDQTDQIDRMFRFHDTDMNTRVMEGAGTSLPESPGV